MAFNKGNKSKTHLCAFERLITTESDLPNRIFLGKSPIPSKGNFGNAKTTPASSSTWK